MNKKINFEIITAKPGIQNPVNVFLANKGPGTMVMVGSGIHVDAVGKLRYEEFDQATARVLVHARAPKVRSSLALAQRRCASTHRT